MPTIWEIGQSIKRQSENGKALPSSPSIVAKMKPTKFDQRPGLRTLSPSQLLSLEVPTLARANGRFAGFQRPEMIGHARKIADAIADGAPMPAIEVGLLPDGTAVLVDGQHRALGAVMCGCGLQAGASQRAIAEAMGVSKATAQRRLARLGLAADAPRGGVDRAIHAVPQTEDIPEGSTVHTPDGYWDEPPEGVTESEVVDGEVVDEPGQPALLARPAPGRGGRRTVAYRAHITHTRANPTEGRERTTAAHPFAFGKLEINPSP